MTGVGLGSRYGFAPAAPRDRCESRLGRHRHDQAWLGVASRPANLSASDGVVVPKVGDAVGVGVACLGRTQLPVVTVTGPQHPQASTAEISDPARTPSWACSSFSLPTPKASSPISSDAVNSIPASSARRTASHQLTPVHRGGTGEPLHQPRRPEHPDTFADHSTQHDADRDRISQRRAQPAGPATDTPAAKNTKTCTRKPCDNGRHRCSKCGLGVDVSQLIFADARQCRHAGRPVCSPYRAGRVQRVLAGVGGRAVECG